MAGALSILCPYEIAESSVNAPSHLSKGIAKWHENRIQESPNDIIYLTKSIDVKTVLMTVITFSGNIAFRHRLENLEVKVLLVVNKNNVAPVVPRIFANETSRWLNCLMKPLRDLIHDFPCTYSHVAEFLEMDHVALHPRFKPKRKTMSVTHSLHLVYLLALHSVSHSLPYLSVRCTHCAHKHPYDPQTPLYRVLITREWRKEFALRLIALVTAYPYTRIHLLLLLLIVVIFGLWCELSWAWLHFENLGRWPLFHCAKQIFVRV